MFRRPLGLWKPSRIHLSKSLANCANQLDRPIDLSEYSCRELEARYELTRGKCSARTDKSMMLNELQNIAVHNESKNAQKEDEANLNEAFLHRNAEIAAEYAFDREHQNVATV